MFWEKLLMIEAAYQRRFSDAYSFRRHVSLSDFSTMRCGGEAAALVLPKSAEEVLFLLSASKKAGISTVFVGNGSNTLFLSGMHRALFIVTHGLSALSYANDIVTAEAGVSLSRLCRFLTAHALTGGEALFGIPATVGGAVVMNAGAYGAEIGDCLLSTDCLVPTEDGYDIRTLSKEEHSFSYRSSIFEDNREWFILRSRFSFPTGEPSEILARMHAVSEKRRLSQPVSLPSLGSVFRRPKLGYAAKYIEDAGLRGYRIGGACVSETHTGFIINDKNATPEEILLLADEIERRVYDAFGVSLQKEIRIVR